MSEESHEHGKEYVEWLTRNLGPTGDTIRTCLADLNLDSSLSAVKSHFANFSDDIKSELLDTYHLDVMKFPNSAIWVALLELAGTSGWDKGREEYVEVAEVSEGSQAAVLSKKSVVKQAASTKKCGVLIENEYQYRSALWKFEDNKGVALINGITKWLNKLYPRSKEQKADMKSFMINFAPPSKSNGSFYIKKYDSRSDESNKPSFKVQMKTKGGSKAIYLTLYNAFQMSAEELLFWDNQKGTSMRQDFELDKDEDVQTGVNAFILEAVEATAKPDSESVNLEVQIIDKGNGNGSSSSSIAVDAPGNVDSIDKGVESDGKKRTFEVMEDNQGSSILTRPKLGRQAKNTK